MNLAHCVSVWAYHVINFEYFDSNVFNANRVSLRQNMLNAFPVKPLDDGVFLQGRGGPGVGPNVGN